MTGEVTGMSNAMMAAANLYHDPRFFDQSEVRIRNNRLRRQRQLRKHIMVLAAVLFTACFMMIFMKAGMLSDAHTQDQAIDYKYYKTITVSAGDSLWNIAQDYISYAHYDNVNEYMDEVREINHLSDDAINAGSNLIIPYYSSEFVQ